MKTNYNLYSINKNEMIEKINLNLTNIKTYNTIVAFLKFKEIARVNFLNNRPDFEEIKNLKRPSKTKIMRLTLENIGHSCYLLDFENEQYLSKILKMYGFNVEILEDLINFWELEK